MRRGFRSIMPLAAMLAAVPVCAHHSIGMIAVDSPVWVRATVVRYEPRNPHVLIHLDGGRVIEGPILARLARMSVPRDFLKPGDVIELCGFPFRHPTTASPALHAHLLVLPDGRRQPWGPYGRLDNCLRAGDSARQWVDFIDGAPMAHEYWCRSVAMTAKSVAPEALVDEVTRGLATPCR